MTIDEYLAGDFAGEPVTGALGEESEWLDFCELELRGSKIHVVDPGYAADEQEGRLVALGPGHYRVQVRCKAFGSDVRISRLRAVLPEVDAEEGAEIGDTGIDMGWVGIYDFEVFTRAWGTDSDASWDRISPAIENADLHGIAVLDESAGAVMPFVSSGFRDGTFPVRELLARGSRVGFAVTFIRPDEKYPF